MCDARQPGPPQLQQARAAREVQVSALLSGIQEEVRDGGALQGNTRDPLQAIRLRGLVNFSLNLNQS